MRPNPPYVPNLLSDHWTTRGEITTSRASSNSTIRVADNGAHERNRTADLLLTMQMLYRLSYVGGAAARGKTQTRSRADPYALLSQPRSAPTFEFEAKNPERPPSPLKEGRR